MEDVFALVKKYGIEVPPYAFAETHEEAVEKAKPLFPVVMKAYGEALLHKTEVGGVILNIKSEDEVGKAFKKLSSLPGAEKVLIQKMAKPGLEMIVGGKKDEQFGEMVLVGLGGIYVEIFKDVSARICPLDEGEALRMIKELKAYSILSGARGKRYDVKALAGLCSAVCKLMMKEDIKELDFNPVFLYSKGYSVVDVKIIR